MRLSKISPSSSVGDGGGVSIEVVVVIPQVIATIVVMGVGVVGLQGVALSSVALVFSVSGTGL